MALGDVAENGVKKPGRQNEEKFRRIATIDSLIEELGGCGLFQSLLVGLTYLTYLPSAFDLLMMVFGSFDPGWTCSDDLASAANSLDGSPVQSIINTSALASKLFSINLEDDSANPLETETSDTFADYSDDILGQNSSIDSLETSTCRALASCKNITFRAGTSTIVTEWGLVCDKSWILSLIISSQMVGLFIGSYMAGQIGDKFGRRASVYGSLAVAAVANIVAIFSVNWEMFAAVRFFIGAGTGGITITPFVYASEFVTGPCRGYIATFPHYNLAACVFALAVWLLKEWKAIHIASAAMSILFFLPVFWMPESIRFLAVHGRVDKAIRVVEKIATLNRRPLPDTDVLTLVAEQEKANHRKRVKYSYVHLFRKGLRKPTLAMGMVWAFISVAYYAIGFGITSLPGNFYINLFVLAAAPIPARLAVPFALNRIGRKLTSIICLSLSSLACLSIVVVQFVEDDNVADLSATVLALTASVLIEAGWCAVALFIIELYPTAVRNLCFGFAVAAGRLGGIIAPYLIPKDTIPLHVAFAVMGMLISLSCAGLLSLPETRGKELQDTLMKLKEEQIALSAPTSVGVEIPENSQDIEKDDALRKLNPGEHSIC